MSHNSSFDSPSNSQQPEGRKKLKRFNVNRRNFLAGTGALGVTAALAPAAQAQAWNSSAGSLAGSSFGPGRGNGSNGNDGNSGGDNNGGTDTPLRFNGDGKFKIVQFNDTQDDHLTDRRTIEFMGKVLDQEKPDFALINGDVISSGPKTTEQAFQAVNNVVLPMESRKIPWAITFGNHDEDSMEDGTQADEIALLNFVRKYKYNLNVADDPIHGESNVSLLVQGNAKPDPAFAIWLLDSGNYIGEELAGQETKEIPGYDYIHSDQIQWYRDTSRGYEERYGKKIPGLMYFHIPTYEHRDMWFGGPYNNDLIKHGQAKKRHSIEGVKNEDVYVGAFNPGIYSAVRERGDVLGIYCGHDHINTFNGNYFGVELGYCPGTGFGPYGLKDGTWSMHTLRGARVFELDESDERVYKSTRLVFAKELGLDMNPKKQPLEKPADLPEYVSFK